MFVCIKNVVSDNSPWNYNCETAIGNTYPLFSEDGNDLQSAICSPAADRLCSEDDTYREMA